MNDSKAMFRFRESFRGFNKDDVNAYIQQVNIKFSRRETELLARISELEASLGAAANESAAPENVQESAVTSELDALRAENEALKQKLEEKGVEKTDDKSLYDSMSSQVGNILIMANTNAEKLISDAKAEAARIKADAEYEAEKLKLSTEQKMNSMVAKLDESLKSVSDSYFNDYYKLVEEAQSRFGEITDSMKTRSEQLLINADTTGRTIEREIAQSYCGSDENNNG